jgi:hypothetical protein
VKSSLAATVVEVSVVNEESSIPAALAFPLTSLRTKAKEYN